MLSLLNLMGDYFVRENKMLRYRFLKAYQNLPRDKDLLPAIAELDPEPAKLAHQYYQATDFTLIWNLVEKIADLTIGTRGFFEWESELESV